MNSPEIKQFIREHSELFWYTPEEKKEEVDEEVLVEVILNYGEMNAIRELINIMGINKISQVFYRTINKSERRKNNYNELTVNFFYEFFQRHAS
jgi:hypothetical protein